MSATNLLHVLGQLWIDDAASVHGAELVLIMVLLMIGMVVGMTSLRDAGVTEFADFGQALSQLNQSYSYSGLTLNFLVGTTTATIITTGSQFVDTVDFCDLAADEDTITVNSRCITLCNPSGPGQFGESSSLP